MLVTEELFRRLGAATISFANLKDIRQASDVECLFPWAAMSLAGNPEAPEIYGSEQKLLQRTLNSLIAMRGEIDRIKEGHRTLHQATRSTAGEQESHFLFGSLTLTESGFVLDIPPEGTFGVKTSWLLFVDAALTVEENGRFLRSKRLGQCRYCAEYYFDGRQQRSRTRPLLYCPGSNHRKLEELEKRRKERHL